MSLKWDHLLPRLCNFDVMLSIIILRGSVTGAGAGARSGSPEWEAVLHWHQGLSIEAWGRVFVDNGEAGLALAHTKHSGSLKPAPVPLPSHWLVLIKIYFSASIHHHHHHQLATPAAPVKLFIVRDSICKLTNLQVNFSLIRLKLNLNNKNIKSGWHGSKETALFNHPLKLL